MVGWVEGGARRGRVIWSSPNPSDVAKQANVNLKRRTTSSRVKATAKDRLTAKETQVGDQDHQS